MTFFYVYILESEATPENFYTGFTEDLKDRLKIHNSGKVPHTAKLRPWRIKTAVAFTDRERAMSEKFFGVPEIHEKVEGVTKKDLFSLIEKAVVNFSKGH